MAAPSLQISDICRSYQAGGETRRVLDGLSLSAAPGEIIGIVGASGCGKSTLLNIVAGLDSADSGSAHLGQLDILKLSPQALDDYRRRQVGMVFQDHHLLDQCSVLENVLLPALAARRVGAARPQALKLLEQVRLADRADDLPHRLSGGERQRVALVRAMVNGPHLLLADEPTGNLDADSGHEVMTLLETLVRTRQMIALVVTHNMALRQFFTRTMRLDDGRLVEE